jgi:hypothetical protein
MKPWVDYPCSEPWLVAELMKGEEEGYSLESLPNGLLRIWLTTPSRDPPAPLPSAVKTVSFNPCEECMTACALIGLGLVALLMGLH